MKNGRGKTVIGTIGLICAAASLFAVAGCAAKNRASANIDAAGLDTDLDVQQVKRLFDPFEEVARYHLAQDHFIIARDYERRGDLEAAAQYYETAYEFWPASSFMRKMLVERYMAAEDYGRALALFGGDPKLNDLTSEEKRAIGRIYLRLSDVARAAEAIEALGGDKNEEDLYSLGLLYNSMGEKSKALRNFREFFGRNEQFAGEGIRFVQFNIGERKFADAESLAVVLRAAYPDNADVAALLGTVRYLNGDTASAVKIFGEALALDSLNEEALRTLARIHVVRDNYTEAVSYYRRLTAQAGIGGPYRRGLALLLFHMKDYRGAEKMIDSLIMESGPESSKDLPGVQELHLYRGLIYSQTKRTEKAAAELRAAIALDPLYEDAWRELCYLYILGKDKDKAHVVVEQYNAAFPESGAGWRFRGYVLNMQEKYDGAVAALKQAVRIDPSDYFSWFEMGSILERQKRVNESAEAFRNVLRIRPDDAQAANYLGYMWADADMMLDSAKLLIEIALEKEPKNGAYLDSYAWVFYRMGDYKKALLYINKAIEQMKDDPVPYEHLGDILFKLNDYRSAEAAYKRSLELKSEEAKRIRERLAEIKKLMGGKKER